MTVGDVCDIHAIADGGDGFGPVSALSDRGVVEELLGVRRRVARLEGRAAALLAEVERRGIPEKEGLGRRRAG